MSTQILLAVIGVGGVSRAFFSQIPLLQAPAKPAVIFVSRSKKQLYANDHSPVNVADLDHSSSPNLSLPDVAQYLASATQKANSKVVVIDNTSSQDVADFYPQFLSQGISVITPSKKAFSSNIKLWDDIFASAYPSNLNGGLVYHESSVMAGLPVISTIKDLIATGDKVTKIEGVFSGTMSFLFNSFQPSDAKSSTKWSAIVSQAKEAGYTEPDPRDDLNGMDVARKCTILARLTGWKVAGPDAFPVQSLIPSALASASSADEFMTKLPDFDGEMEGYKEAAEKEGKVVRYVGSLDVQAQKIEVGLKMIDKSNPLAGLKGSDNLIAVHSERYAKAPLVVQGSGAGGDVTAMGISSDLIKAIERLSR